jgi:hypothetical protein
VALESCNPAAGSPLLKKIPGLSYVALSENSCTVDDPTVDHQFH